VPIGRCKKLFANEIPVRNAREQQGKLDKDEEKFFKKPVKTLGYHAENPGHNGLASHEIEDFTCKYGIKIFQSFLENRTPIAGRMFWVYGLEKGNITVLWRLSLFQRTKREGLTSELIS
jgi:hypothetical protein